MSGHRIRRKRVDRAVRAALSTISAKKQQLTGSQDCLFKDNPLSQVSLGMQIVQPLSLMSSHGRKSQFSDATELCPPPPKKKRKPQDLCKLEVSIDF